MQKLYIGYLMYTYMYIARSIAACSKINVIVYIAVHLKSTKPVIKMLIHTILALHLLMETVRVLL